MTDIADLVEAALLGNTAWVLHHVDQRWETLGAFKSMTFNPFACALTLESDGAGLREWATSCYRAVDGTQYTAASLCVPFDYKYAYLYDGVVTDVSAADAFARISFTFHNYLMRPNPPRVGERG